MNLCHFFISNCLNILLDLNQLTTCQFQFMIKKQKSSIEQNNISSGISTQNKSVLKLFLYNMLTLGEIKEYMYVNSPYYHCNFFVNLKLFQNKIKGLLKKNCA